MRETRLRLALPYAIGLLIAVALWHQAGTIAYTPRGNELGPDVWPKLAIGLMAVVCLFEIGRALVGGRETHAISDQLEGAEDNEPVRRTPLLIAGIVLIVTYAVLVPIVGFLLGALLFMAVFMYLGGYRNHVVIWSVSIGATLLIAILFQRFAYISLPRGIAPFDRFTDLIRIMLGG